MPSVSIVIPCLNEAATIGRAVDAAKRALADLNATGEVIVADNGSTDGSGELARGAGARVVEVSVRGYGAALHGGIQAATTEFVGFADADLSYPFAAFGDLYRTLHAAGADLVLGSRLRGLLAEGAMPLLNRYLGTPVLSMIMRLMTSFPVSDCNSGMRMLRRDKYDALELSAEGMEYACEMLVRSARCGWIYAEVPIAFHKDERGRAPHLRRWRDGVRSLWVMLRGAVV